MADIVGTSSQSRTSEKIVMIVALEDKCRLPHNIMGKNDHRAKRHVYRLHESPKKRRNIKIVRRD